MTKLSWTGTQKVKEGCNAEHGVQDGCSPVITNRSNQDAEDVDHCEAGNLDP
jgi:hypothetical protein